MHDSVIDDEELSLKYTGSDVPEPRLDGLREATNTSSTAIPRVTASAAAITSRSCAMGPGHHQ